jgi:hypothetical protein
MADLGQQLGLGGGAEAGEAADGAALEPEPPAKRARKVALSFPKVPPPSPLPPVLTGHVSSLLPY